MWARVQSRFCGKKTPKVAGNGDSVLCPVFCLLAPSVPTCTSCLPASAPPLCSLTCHPLWTFFLQVPSHWRAHRYPKWKASFVWPDSHGHCHTTHTLSLLVSGLPTLRGALEGQGPGLRLTATPRACLLTS